MRATEFEDVYEKFEVDGIEYKARMTQIDAYLFEMKIYQKIDDRWVKIFRKEIEADFFENIELLDWNFDGKLDVKFRFVAGATGESYNTLLLYKNPTEFVDVRDYWWVSSSYRKDETLISKSPLIYYGNIYWGCAGDSYQSILYTIQEHELKQIAYANIDFCDEPFVIKVFSRKDGESHLYNTYDIGYVLAFDKEDDFLWQNFINHFWRHHYEEFID